MSHFVITGIGTNIGKTVVSAILCNALKADYWKPIQAGNLDELDSDLVRLLSPLSFIHKENELLKEPMSPHEAARLEGKKLTIDSFQIPAFSSTTLIEGAGGVMVPINDDGLCYIDVFKQWNFPVYVVVSHYLGSINHSLLTLHILSQKQIPIAGIIINGHRNEASERAIATQFPSIKMTFIPHLDDFSLETIQKTATAWIEQLN